MGNYVRGSGLKQEERSGAVFKVGAGGLILFFLVAVGGGDEVVIDREIATCTTT